MSPTVLTQPNITTDTSEAAVGLTRAIRPVLIAVTASVGAAVAAYLGFNDAGLYAALTAAAAIGLLVVFAAYDHVDGRIPNRLSMIAGAVALLALGAAFVFPVDASVRTALTWAFLAALSTVFIWVVTDGSAIGGADVKFVPSIVLLLGLYSAAGPVIAALCTCAILSVSALIRRGRTVRLGVPLAIGSGFAILAAPAVVALYAAG
jgi:prepilin signal peptidase PulO-like enzyme (type II secretory pathway)